MASKPCIMIYMIYNIGMIYNETQTEPTDTEALGSAGIFASPVVFDILIKDVRLTQGNINETCGWCRMKFTNTSG